MVRATRGSRSGPITMSATIKMTSISVKLTSNIPHFLLTDYFAEGAIGQKTANLYALLIILTDITSPAQRNDIII
jgi:hypothetical protein